MAAQDTNDGRSVATVTGDESALREWAERLVARARAEGVELTGDGGLLTAMVRQVLQTGLEVEMASISATNATIPRDAGAATAATAAMRRPSRPTSATSSCGCRATGTAPSSRPRYRSINAGWMACRERGLAVCQGPDDG